MKWYTSGVRTGVKSDLLSFSHEEQALQFMCTNWICRTADFPKDSSDSTDSLTDCCIKSGLIFNGESRGEERERGLEKGPGLLHRMSRAKMHAMKSLI